jgi:hypothetical protein
MCRLSLGLVFTIGLVAAPAAEGALVLRMAVLPSRPQVGHAVVLQIRTYAPLADPSRRCGYRLKPWRIAYPFNVQAVGPDRKLHRIRVKQGRGNLYAGQFVPTRAGAWTIRVTNFGPSYARCSGSQISFRVFR